MKIGSELSKSSTNRPSLLFLAHLLPWPLEGGGPIKSYHTLRLLAEVYDVTLLAMIRRPEEAQNLGPLSTLCKEVRTVLLPRGTAAAKANDAMSALRALIARHSFIVKRDALPAMQSAVDALLESESFAAVHVDHLQMIQFVWDCKDIPVVLDHHNIEHRIPKRIAESVDGKPLMRWYAGLEWPKLRDFEIEACRRAHRVLTVSEEDRDGLIAIAPELSGKIEAVPIGVDTDYFGVVQRNPDSKTLLSIGTMYWPPNIDSMLYFCADIFPKIKSRISDVRLNIVGAKPVASIKALAESDASVTVTGSVPDVRDWSADCGVFIVPLRAGSGMRVKILNAMAMGLPVVSTPVGAEGIEVVDGENILLADGEEAFADAVVRLLEDPALGTRIGEAGRRLMDERYGWNRIGERLRSVYERIVPQTMKQQ